MSHTEFDPKVFDISEALEDAVEVFPDAEYLLPADLGRTINDRFRNAGFGIVAVVYGDGTYDYSTFIAEETPVVTAINKIQRDEQAGKIPEGSHEEALNAIAQGNFLESWGLYLTGQNE